MDKLTAIAKLISEQKLPPVDQWEPSKLGSIDIRIDVQGNWFHEGELIKRKKMVRLFSSILWFERNQHYLVTPVEKLEITVEDSPYIIQSAQKIEDAWVVTTNTDEQIIIGDEHPVQLRAFNSQLLPYVRVRYSLWARVNRSVYFQWADDALAKGHEDQHGDDNVVLYSGHYQIKLS